MDGFYYLKFLVALVFVVCLMLLLGWAGRRFSLAQTTVGKRRDKRLHIVEQRMLDSKHRLVLVSRDDVEHLILVGAEHDLVVESGITPPKLKSTSQTKLQPQSKSKPRAKSASKPASKSKSLKKTKTGKAKS